MNNNAICVGGLDEYGQLIVRVIYENAYYQGRLNICENMVVFPTHVPAGVVDLVHEYFKLPPPIMDYTLCV